MHKSHPSTGIGDYGALTDFRLGPFSNDMRQFSFNVSIMDDMIPEEDEVFTASLILSPDGNLVIVAPDLATVTILDDDGKSWSLAIIVGMLNILLQEVVWSLHRWQITFNMHVEWNGCFHTQEREGEDLISTVTYA